MAHQNPMAEAARRAGGPTAMAKALGESKQAVCNWISRGQPPASRTLAVEALSGVSRRLLRSDWADYWPDHSEPMRQDGGASAFRDCPAAEAATGEPADAAAHKALA